MTPDTVAPAPVSRLELEEQDRLRALDELELFGTEVEERFDRITSLVQRLFGVPIAMITLVGRDQAHFKSRQGMDLVLACRTDTFCNVAVQQADTFVVEDLSLDERFRSHELVRPATGLRFYAAQPLLVTGGQAIGTLCLLDDRPRTLSPYQANLLRDLARSVERELTLHQEFDQAARMQRGLLPKRAPVLPGYDLAAACVPAKAVGGDLYDWYPLPGGVGFTVADVMGKGAGAAIMAATVRAVLRSVVREREAPEAVNHTQKVLQVDLAETGTFVTLMHARLDAATGVVRYVDAGHGLTVLLHADGRADRIPSAGLPLGILESETWVESRVELQPGDALLTFSDGLVDLMGDDVGGLRNLLALVRASSSMHDLVDRVSAISRRERLLDDVTIIALQRRAG